MAHNGIYTAGGNECGTDGDVKHPLRESARGQPCHLRIPGVCNGNPETTVLCHIRRGHVAGMGQKPPDICGVFGCSNCHDVMDGRAGKSGSGLLDEFILEGQQRTLAYWWKNGFIKV